jgi:hypothetical protein
MFDFAVAFSAPGVLPRIVMGPIQEAIKAIITRNKDPWLAFADQFSVDQTALSHTPLVFIDRTSLGPRARQLVFSDPPVNAWGIIPRCGHTDCKGQKNIGSVRVQATERGDKNHNYCRFTCLHCKWSSRWVERPSFVQPLQMRMHFFSHPYPLSDAQVLEARGHLAPVADKRARNSGEFSVGKRRKC